MWYCSDWVYIDFNMIHFILLLLYCMQGFSAELLEHGKKPSTAIRCFSCSGSVTFYVTNRGRATGKECFSSIKHSISHLTNDTQ